MLSTAASSGEASVFSQTDLTTTAPTYHTRPSLSDFAPNVHLPGMPSRPPGLLLRTECLSSPCSVLAWAGVIPSVSPRSVHTAWKCLPFRWRAPEVAMMPATSYSSLWAPTEFCTLLGPQVALSKCFLQGTELTKSDIIRMMRDMEMKKRESPSSPFPPLPLWSYV